MKRLYYYTLYFSLTCLPSLGQATPTPQHCFHSFTALEKIIQNQPVIPGFPWEISLKGALLSQRSRQQARYVEPTIQIQGDHNKIFFPLNKIEPIVEHVQLFSFGSVDQGKFDYYPKPQKTLLTLIFHTLNHIHPLWIIIGGKP